MVAAQKHIGNLDPLKLRRPRKVRILKQSALKTFFYDALLAPKHTLLQPRYRINQHQRRQLATRQHIVTDTDFLPVKTGTNSVVDALVVPA